MRATTEAELKAALADLDALEADMLVRYNAVRGHIRNAIDIENPPAPVVSFILITPSPFGVVVSATVQLTATAYDQTGAEMSGVTFTWASSDTNVASVNSSTGLVTGVGAGSCSITASATGGVQSTPSNCTVSPAVVATVTNSVSVISGVVGAAWSYTVQPKDASGNSLTGRTVTAASTDNAVTGVPQISGYAVSGTFAGAGTANVTATCETIDASAVAATVTAVGSDPNRPTDVTWTTRATMPLTSNAALTTGGLTLETGTLGSTLGTAAGSTYSVNDGNTTLTPGVGPVDSAGRLLWIKVRNSGSGAGNSMRLATSFSGAKSVFFDFTVQLAADWEGHSSNQTKMFWLTSGTLGVANIILSAWGKDQGGVRYAPYWQQADIVAPTPSGTQPCPNNVSSGSMGRGVWARYQCLLVMESSAGVADGFAKWWKNGNLVGTETGIKFASVSGSLFFKNALLMWYWGGTGDTAPYNLYAFMDYAKISSSTSRSAG